MIIVEYYELLYINKFIKLDEDKFYERHKLLKFTQDFFTKKTLGPSCYTSEF